MAHISDGRVYPDHLHPQAFLGIQLFNAGHYFEAHEALEAAWMEETGPIRNLYRGILQVAVAYYHLKRGNYLGARKMLMRSQPWLAPFPDRCLGVDVAGLRRDSRRVEDSLIHLGPQRLAGFDLSLLKPLNVSDRDNPDQF